MRKQSLHETTEGMMEKGKYYEGYLAGIILILVAILVAVIFGFKDVVKAIKENSCCTSTCSESGVVLSVSKVRKFTVKGVEKVISTVEATGSPTEEVTATSTPEAPEEGTEEPTVTETPPLPPGPVYGPTATATPTVTEVPTSSSTPKPTEELPTKEPAKENKSVGCNNGLGNGKDCQTKGHVKNGQWSKNNDCDNQTDCGSPGDPNNRGGNKQEQLMIAPEQNTSEERVLKDESKTSESGQEKNNGKKK